MLALAARDASPEMLDEVYGHTRQAIVLGQKVARESLAERLGLLNRLGRRQGIHGILHRVGRQHRGVVAIRVRGVVVSFEAHGNRQIPQIVEVRSAEYLHEPNAFLAVRRVSQHAELHENRGSTR